jgi:zinc/manganese transport system substrate-binding protein
MMLRMTRAAALSLLALSLACLPGSVQAALNVFACEPEWAALATELGGDKVSAFSATTARQDPHQIQARPALIARLRAADLVVCTGAELEIGWMPVLLRQAANSRVQPGTPGYVETSTLVRLLEVPTRLDRAEGDIHAAGNPHVQTDPRRIATIAAALAQRLAQIDGANAAWYAQRQQEFAQRWTAALRQWEARAAPLKGTPVVVYHKSWVYLEDWLGMREVGTIEPKPGIPPGSAYLSQLLQDIPARGVKMILYAAYQEPRAPQYLSERTHVPAVELPFTVGGSEQAKDLYSVFDDTISRLLAALEGRVGKS